MILKLQDAKVGAVAIVSVAGRLDGAGAPEILAHCNTLITGGATRLLLDVEGVDYISSAGLRSLLVLAKSIKAVHGSLVLCNLSPMVRDVMAISCCDRILTLAVNRDSGIAALT